MTVRLPLLLLIATQVACSFSYSSKSLSDSASSSSASASSSSPGGAERAYRDDIRDYTRTYVSTGGRADSETFRADLARIAERHGITDWESNPATYTAVGEGLRKGGVSEAELMAYKRNLSGGDPRRMDAIQQGYDAAE